MKNVKECVDLLKLIEENVECNFKLYLAGGLLRDTEHGVKPKDVDIMVSPDNINFDIVDFLDFINDLDYLTTYNNLIDLGQYLPDMAKRNISGLIMCRLSDGTEVQFIVYNKFIDQLDITLDMDINICQITMNSSGETIKSNAYVDGFENKHIECLHEYSVKRQRSRLDRMLVKYPNFTFTPV